MKAWRKSMMLMLAILALGAVRMPFEDGLCRDLRGAGLLPGDLSIGTRDRIGQTSSAVALGGLRTLVATFLNLRAFTFFTEQRWSDVAGTFDTIVDLAPHTRYYWETGSWHLAYNAASYYMNDSKLPPLRRREAWRSSIMAGRVFIERGIRNNPDDWRLGASLGSLLTDPNKFPAFRNGDEIFLAAAEAYRQAADTGKAPSFVRRAQFYSLARVKDREAEALKLGHSLLAAGRENRTPTLLMLVLVLEAHENPSMDVAARAIELFGSPQKAYSALSDHWRRTRERFPIYGVANGIESLEKTLAVPVEKSIFNQPLPPPWNPEDMFQS